MKISCRPVWLAAIWSTAVLAQSSILPTPCIGKTGDDLDRCVRDITPLQIILPPKPAEQPPPPPNPAQLANCETVVAADRNFCLARNEVILECLDRKKYADFDQCFAKYIVRTAKPRAASCQREKPAMRQTCETRNVRFADCLADPLRYFLCLDNLPR